MTVTTDGAGRTPAMREALVEELRDQGAVRSDRVADAFRVVPRHLFAPGVSLEQAYANDAVVTKRDGEGVSMSSVSAPRIQAMMLEQAEIEPGMQCLEVGSGGYNAALMGELAGHAGQVTTVDIDPGVTERATSCLGTAGYDRVNVVLADAEHGVPENAPYDRIIVTVGAWDIPPAWTDQLAAAGRLVVPLRVRGLTRTVVFERRANLLVSLGHEMCGFVPMQGAGEHCERLILLHGEDVGLRIDDDAPTIEAEGLRRSLLEPRTEVWSGVRFGGSEPFDGLLLWLATTLPEFGLLSRTRTHTAQGLVDPSSPMGTPTLLEADSFAYHTFRQLDDDVYEFGAYAHGPNAQRLADQMAEQIRAWDVQARASGLVPTITVGPADTQTDAPTVGRVISKRHTTVTVSWP